MLSQGGVTTKLDYKPVPYDSAVFYDELFIIPDYTRSCPIDIYLQLNNKADLDWVTLTSKCIGLRVDQLEFLSNFEHYITFPGLTTPSSTVPVDSTIFVESFITTVNKQFGYFVTALNSIPNAPSLQLKYSSASEDVLGTLYDTNVTIFDSIITTDIKLAGSRLTFEGSTTIFDQYHVYIDGSFTSEKHWDETSLVLNGYFSDTQLLTELNDYVHVFFTNTANNVMQKRQNAESAAEYGLQVLTSLEKNYNESQKKVDNATADFNAVQAKVNLWNRTTEEALQNYTSSLTNYLSNVTLIDELRNCSLRTCNEICVSSTNCTVCYKDSMVIKTGSCPVYEPVTKTATEEYVYYTVGWRYELRSRLCRSFFRFSVFCIASIQVCWDTVCVSYNQATVKTRAITYTTLELKQKPCEIEQFNLSSPSECCQTYPCSYTIPNPACVSQKEECLMQLDQIEIQSDQLRILYGKYLRAQENLFIANLELASKLSDLNSAEEELQLVKPAYESAKLSYGISLSNLESVVNRTEENYKLVVNLNTYRNSSQLVHIRNITFTQTIATSTPFIFPVTIIYDMPFSGQTYLFSYVMNFNSPKNLLKRSIAGDLLDDFLSNTEKRRRRRQINTNNIYKEFQLRCTDLENIQKYFNQLTSDLASTIEDITKIHNTLLEGNNSLDINNTITSNLTEGYDKFMESLNKSASNTLQIIERNAFLNWQSKLKVFHNSTQSVGGYECTDFYNCLQTSLTVLETLLSDIPEEKSKDILSSLQDQKSSVVAIGYNPNYTLEYSLQLLEIISELVNSTIDIGYWCSNPPVIRMTPPLEVNVSVGDNLILYCQAQSNLPVQYRWKKDGLYLSNQRSNTLSLYNVRLDNAGIYVCQAGSAVGSTDALPSTVNVYYEPIMNLTISDAQTLEGNDDGLRLACDAHSWPPPGWKWYFRSDTQSKWKEIEGVDANTYFLVDPRVEQEGWYKCEASNWMGNKSSTAYVTVLPIKIVRIKYPVEFTINKTVQSVPSGGATTLVDAVVDSFTKAFNLQLIKLENVSVGPSVNGKDSLTVKFNLITLDLNVEDIVPLKVEDILTSIAVPIGELEDTKIKMETTFVNSSITIEEGQVQYKTLPLSLGFGTRAFVCPDGFGLDVGLVFCGKCFTFV